MSTHRRLLQTLSMFVLLSMLFSGFALPTASAQGGDDLHRQINPQTGKVSFLAPESGRRLSATRALGLSASARPADPGLALAKRFGPEFGLKDPARDLKKLKTNQAGNGRLSVRYQQTYQGIPVMAGELIVNTDESGDLYSINGEISPDLSLSTQPTISAEQSREAALQGAARWYRKSTEDFVASEPALWIFDESLLETSTRPAELVWRMEVKPKEAGMPVRELVLVNAERGSISLHFNQMDTAWGNFQKEKSVSNISPENAEPSRDGTTAHSPATHVVAQTSTTLYVATTGSDSSDCSATTPCATINAAIEKAAASGDTIKVAIGTYTGSGSQVVLVSGKSLILSGGWDATFGTQNGMATIDGQGARRGILTNSSANVVVDHFIIQNGFMSGDTGGGIRNFSSTMTLSNSIVTDNVSTSGGGGIYNYGTLTINNTAINENTAGDSCCSGGGGGGGIESNSGALTMNNSTVNGNTLLGGFPGSGISAWGTVILNNSTISGNSGGYGEGVYVNFGTTTLNNSTISGNQSYGIKNSAGTVTVQNTIVAGNGTSGDCSGTVTTQGYNLIGNTSGCTFTPTTGDLVNVDAKLGGLFGFPGSMPLLPGSPAINAGNPATPGSGGSACLATDQRGVTRPVGARCDIGAYEYAPSGSVARLLIASGNGQHAGPNLAFLRPLVIVALDSQGNPVSGVNVTFTAPASGASGTFADTHTRTTTSITSVSGIATASLTANSQLGTYTVSASASSVSSASFDLENSGWFVVPGGNDSNSCSTPGSPCATINGAINKASVTATDFILVTTGIYTGTGSEVVSVANKSLVLSGGWDATFAVQSGTSTIDGGAARIGVSTNSNANVVIDHFTIQNGFGSGISNYNSSLTLNNSFVLNNVNQQSGGGIFNHGTMTINNTVIRNNTGGDPRYSGGGGGGGIENHSGTMTLNNSLVSGNKLLGGFSGSGIYAAGTLILNNSTVSSNTGGDGTGIYSITNSQITLNNSTISFNASYGFKNVSGDVTLRNTIVAGNGTGRDCYNDTGYDGTVTSQGYNLIGNGTSCSFTSATGDLVGTDSTPIDPRLILLPNHGESTFAIPLLPDSPAINAGNPAAPGSGGNACLRTDQRGVVRPVGTRCDIGAFEYQHNGTTPAFVFPLRGTPQYLAINKLAPSLLKAVVLDEDGDTVSGPTVIFAAPASGASAIFTSTGTNSSTVVADVNGVATSSALSANSTAGRYAIQATVTGLAASADFEIVNGSEVKTYTANNVRSTKLPGTFLCDQSKPGCTNGTNIYADSAQRYAIGTYELYMDQYGRKGLDNNNMPIISTVNYCDPDTYFACPYDNANWNGEEVVYGTANGYALADDVVAHELTHAVTQYESNLFYYYQSGAINESLSDLWGEYYDQTNGLGTDTPSTKWQIGEDVTGLGAMRSMSYPTLFGDPDMMSSANYYTGEGDNGGVHHNSGVNNKAVFLMVEGGNFNEKTVSPLGWEKTAAIYYEANTNLLVSGADYSDLYYALQQACSNLIGQRGITSDDCAQVKTALDAVEMNSQPVADFNTHAPYCNGGDPVRTILSDDLESGIGNWTFTNGTYTRWQLDSPYGTYARSGSHFLYANDLPTAVTDATARLTSVAIPSGSYLHFAQAYGFETGYYPGDPTLYNFDGGVLEYSTDGGSTWTDAGSLMDYNGYKGTIRVGDGNPLAGRSAFVGSSHGYIDTRLNLASLAGKNVSFRWRMGLDPYGALWGWWLDDVKIYQCEADLVAPAAISDLSATTGTTAGSVNLNWTAVGDDGNTGTANAYFVRYSTSAINDETTWANATAVTTGIPTPKAAGQAESMTVSGLMPGVTYYFAVRAQDDGLNLAGLSNVSSASAKSLGAGIYDDLHSGWTYIGSFITYASPSAYQGGIRYTTAVGDSAEFTFKGSQISILYTGNTNRGKVEVFLDGNPTKLTTFDEYTSAAVYQKKWTSGDLGVGTHTIKLVHAGPAGKTINIDAIEVGDYVPPVAPGAGMYDDSDTNWKYTGNFITFTSSSAYQGGIRYTTTVGDSAEFTFSGSQISILYTGNTTRGKVDVFLDNNPTKLTTFDEYTVSAVYQKKWTSGDLGAGTHTIKLVHAGASGKMINLDAIEVGTYQAPVVPGTGTYDDADANWKYTGNFITFASTSAYQGGIRYTTTMGDFAEFTFSGSQISILYTGNTNRGKVDVFLDSNPTKLATFDEYTSAAVYQKKWTSGDLGAGTHTVKLVHAGASGKMINLDAIEVGTYQAPGAGTYDDTHAGWKYTGSFTTFASSSAYQGGIHYTTTVGDSAEFTFTGSQIILLYTGNTNRGKVDVFLDGNPTKVATIDEYTASAVFQQHSVAITVGAGTHTVKLVHAGPAGTTINLDAMEVLP